MLFLVQTMRPQLRLMPVRGSVDGTAGPNYGVRAPPVDSISAEDLVNNLDAMAAAAFRNIVQEVCFKIRMSHLTDNEITGSICGI